MKKEKLYKRLIQLNFITFKFFNTVATSFYNRYVAMLRKSQGR
jgi:hypothetical protein